MIDLQPPARQDMPADRQAAWRAALLTEMTASRRLPVRRLAFGGLAATALVGGVAAALVAVPDGGQDAGPVQVVPMSATQILDRAAEAAGKVAEPRPDQYVHTESEARGDYLPGGLVREQTWYSVNGSRIGLKIEAGERFWRCEAVQRPVPSKTPADCKNQPFYRRDLPNDAKTMRDWLYRSSAVKYVPADVRAYGQAQEVLRSSRLTPAAQAAMFKAIGTLPGVKVVRSTRQHIVVGQTWLGLRAELLFEPRTFRLIGGRSVADNDRSFQPEGSKEFQETLLRGGKKRYGADRKEGTVATSWTIISQRVVDAIPPAYLKDGS
ncbi:CU044_5270 family protein [Actinomadura hibisca]|uniref:CU044_5270 family protein n=1 Tax=Actinomadura hibisca TaxID=68565 RepID=UPI00082A366E|nr:CU044_5270 family protein [Actinomadura hibisca]